MPAESEKQRKFMGAVLSYKQGKMSEDEASEEVKKAAKSMSVSKIKDFLVKPKNESIMKKNITLNELKTIIKEIIKEEYPYTSGELGIEYGDDSFYENYDYDEYEDYDDEDYDDEEEPIEELPF
jgi:hypothetical protein